jgi:hypothetical protein
MTVQTAMRATIFLPGPGIDRKIILRQVATDFPGHYDLSRKVIKV